MNTSSLVRDFKIVSKIGVLLNPPPMHHQRSGYVPPETSEKCIVVVPTCSGMGPTKFKFWVLRSCTNDPDYRVGISVAANTMV